MYASRIIYQTSQTYTGLNGAKSGGFLKTTFFL